MSSQAHTDIKLSGGCHCGAVTYGSASAPTFTAYCHCTKCQRLTGGLFVHTIHIPSSAITITPETALHIYTVSSHPHEIRYRCRYCGAGIAAFDTHRSNIAVWGSTLRRDSDVDGRIVGLEDVRPVLHFHYATRLLDVKDDLRKFMGESTAHLDNQDEERHETGKTEATATGDDKGTSEGAEGEGGDLMTGGCFCGKILYSFAERNVVRSAYCHCTQCQKLSGCPFISTIHLPSSALTLALPPSSGGEDLATPSGATSSSPTIASSAIEPSALPSCLECYSTLLRPHKVRLRCAACGTCIASVNINTGRTSVWGVHLARLPSGKVKHWDKVKPTAHIFYGTRLLDVRDTLPKWVGYDGESERID